MTLAIDPKAMRSNMSSSKAMSTSKDFNAFLGGFNAFGDASVEAANQFSSNSNAATVLAAAFSGTTTYGNLQGGGSPTSFMGSGYSGASYGATGSTEQMLGLGYGTGKYSSGYDVGTTSSSEAVTGTGVNTGELINTMNTNNLKLLELQAAMQGYMQAWTTKSNLLSTHHKAQMTMVEKLNTR